MRGIVCIFFPQLCGKKIKVATSVCTGDRNCPPDSSTAMGSNPVYIKDLAEGHHKGVLQLNGPDDRIRTCGILLPKQALYQTEPRPDIYFSHTVLWNPSQACFLLRCPVCALSSARLRCTPTSATRSGRSSRHRRRSHRSPN